MRSSVRLLAAMAPALLLARRPGGGRRPGRGRGALPRRQVRRVRPHRRRGDLRCRGLDRALADPQDLGRDAAGQVPRGAGHARARPAPVPREHLAPPPRPRRLPLQRTTGGCPAVDGDPRTRRHGLAPAVRQPRGPPRTRPLLPPHRPRLPQGARPLLRPGPQGAAAT